jgi:hypothetical protein
MPILFMLASKAHMHKDPTKACTVVMGNSPRQLGLPHKGGRGSCLYYLSRATQALFPFTFMAPQHQHLQPS